MANGGRKAQKWPYQYPRTSTEPIKLSEFLEQTRGEVVMDRDRLTPEYVAWHERVSARHMTK